MLRERGGSETMPGDPLIGIEKVYTNFDQITPQGPNGGHLMNSIFTDNPKNFISRKFV